MSTQNQQKPASLGSVKLIKACLENDTDAINEAMDLLIKDSIDKEMQLAEERTELF